MLRELDRILVLVAGLPWLTLSLSGLAIGLYALAGPAAGGAVYDRMAIANGEWWRWFSAHWIHSDAGHLAWNVAALLLLGCIVESYRRWLLPLGLLAGSLAVDLWLSLGTTGIMRYCGLSGALNTLLILALWAVWRRSGHPLVWIIGLGSLLKIVAETVTGQALLTQAAWASVPLAHLAGWIGGCTLLLLYRSHSVRPC